MKNLIYLGALVTLALTLSLGLTSCGKQAPAPASTGTVVFPNIRV